MAYLWAFSSVLVHSRKTRSLSSSVLYSLLIVIGWIIYTTLNKLGVATSIHSFVTSRSLKTHYPSILLFLSPILCVITLMAMRVIAVSAIILVGAYLQLQWCIFLKKPIVALTLILFKLPVTKKPAVICAHFCVLLTSAALFFFNCSNYSFLGMRAFDARLSWLSCKGAM